MGRNQPEIIVPRTALATYAFRRGEAISPANKTKLTVVAPMGGRQSDPCRIPHMFVCR
jgi:hypothetical protein